MGQRMVKSTGWRKVGWLMTAEKLWKETRPLFTSPFLAAPPEADNVDPLADIEEDEEELEENEVTLE